MNFFKSYSKFHKIYFVSFLILNLIIFFSPTFTGSKESIGELFTWSSVIPLISTLTGLLAAIYTARGQVLAYVWGFFNVSTYIIVSYSQHLYGEVSLYLLYMLPMQIVGFYSWKKNLNGNEVKAKTMKAKHWIMFAIFVCVFWGLYATYVYHLPNILDALFGISIPMDKQFMIDSLTATLTVSAVILATNRFVEQWYMWMISDSIGIILFIIKIVESGSFTVGAFSGAVMWIQFTSNAIYGFITWRKLNKKAQLEA